jgi:dihydroneopterin aldolase
MQVYQVGLDEVRFYAYHGLFPEERILGNWFVLSVQVSKSSSTIELAHINSTYDYGIIYQICKDVMAVPVDLLETVSINIAEKLKQSFVGLTRYEIHIWKEQPPMGLTSGKSRVSVIEEIDL